MAYYRRNIDRVRVDAAKNYKQYSEKLYDRLHEFRADGTFCDYVMVAGEEQIPVHKVVMAAYSGYFYAMVTSDMRERGENTITLDAIDGIGLRAVVDFVYSGKINIDLVNVSSILEAASYLQVQEVVEQCEVFLTNIISINNCVSITPLIELYAVDKKYPDIANFMFENFLDMSIEQHNTMSIEQFLAVLSDDRLKVKSESYLIMIVKNWLEVNKPCVFSTSCEEIRPGEEPWLTFTQLMAEIRWCLLSADETQEIDKEILSVMNEIPKCREMLQEANSYRVDIYRQPLMQTSRSRVRRDGLQLVTMAGRPRGGGHRKEYRTTDMNERISNPSENNVILRKSSDNVFGQVAVSFNNFLFVCGGYDIDGECSSRKCVRYDPRFNKWIDISPLNIGRRMFVLLTHGNNLYAIGGIDQIIQCDTEARKYKSTSTCETYDIEHNTWSMNHEDVLWTMTFTVVGGWIAVTYCIKSTGIMYQRKNGIHVLP